MDVASTKYPWHKTQINWRLTSVSFTLPPLQGTTGSPNNFCSSHGGGGDDDDDDMVMTGDDDNKISEISFQFCRWIHKKS